MFEFGRYQCIRQLGIDVLLTPDDKTMYLFEDVCLNIIQITYYLSRLDVEL